VYRAVIAMETMMLSPNMSSTKILYLGVEFVALTYRFSRVSKGLPSFIMD
jgi:hypothetical protein